MDINVIVDSEFVRPDDADTIFTNEPVICQVDSSTTIQDLCVDCGAYKSKSQARKSGRIGELPTGYTEMKLNKTMFLFLWNPTE